MQQIQHYINGEFIDGTQNIESMNPSTGKTYCLVPVGESDHVDKAVKAAKDAFKSWSKKSKFERSAHLMKIADLITQRIPEFALAESSEQGKPLSLSLSLDIPRAVDNFRFFATAILHEQSAFSEALPGFQSYVLQQPVGVAALISPWNLPLYLLSWKIAPCLAYGNTAVCKPSEFTSMTAYLLSKVFKDAGLPDGVCNIIFGDGPTTGNSLINHRDVDLISFTGGTATGKLVYQAAAKATKKVSLELGGKNANIVFADCDMELALTTSIRSSFTNQGEVCLCGSRIFVHRSIYDDFVARFLVLAEMIVVGDPMHESTNMGALISLQHLQKVLSYIDIARQEGGKILCGGHRLTTPALKDGYFVLPTVITNLHPTTSRLQTEEIFGPVVTISPFDTEEEVIGFANATEYGLSASIWTRDFQRMNRVSRALDVATVWINTWMTRDLNVPFGGVKMSGIGREGGKDSLNFFTEAKTVCVRL